MGQNTLEIPQIANIDAEESVLGFLLDSDIEEATKQSIAHSLSPAHFTEQRKNIFRLIQQTQIFDRILLAEKVKEYPKLKLSVADIGTIPIFYSAPSIINSFIDILRLYKDKRLLIDQLQISMTEIINGNDIYATSLALQTNLLSFKKEKTILSNQDLLEQVLAEDPTTTTLKTGYESLDKALAINRGSISTIAGDSGQLKTTFALDLAFRMARANPNSKIGIFSKEMLATDLLKKEISKHCKIPIEEVMTKKYDVKKVREKMMSIPEFRDNRIQIIAPSSFNGVNDIAKIQLQENYDVWFLDFIQLLEFSKAASDASDYNIQIGQNVRHLLSLSLLTKSAGFLLSQLKKGVDLRRIKKPQVSDIEWSGVIKQLSTYIFFSYYPIKYYESSKLTERDYYLISGKTRFAAPFTMPLDVDPVYGIFTELSQEEKIKRVTKLHNVIGE